MNQFEKYKKIILQTCPFLKIRKIKSNNFGWDNVVLEINDEYIFRFPRVIPKGKYGRFKMEFEILKCLKNKITLKIPEILFVDKTCHFVGYKKIPGSHLTVSALKKMSKAKRAKISYDLANFLAEIHDSMPFYKARKMKVQLFNSRSYLNIIKTKLLPRLKKTRSEKVFYKYVLKNMGIYAKLKPADKKLLFTDLHFQNLAFDKIKCKVNGVFDFGDMTIGDYCADFYPLYGSFPEFSKEVIRDYEKITGRQIDLGRVIVYHIINQLADLASYYDKPKSKQYRYSMRVLKREMKRQI